MRKLDFVLDGNFQNILIQICFMRSGKIFKSMNNLKLFFEVFF